MDETLKIGNEMHGGIVFYLDDTGEHGLVCSTENFSPMKWDGAIKACKDLGDGWYLPNEVELKLMYENLHKKGLGNFVNDYYWSSSELDSRNARIHVFFIGIQDSASKSTFIRARACRAF